MRVSILLAAGAREFLSYRRPLGSYTRRTPPEAAFAMFNIFSPSFAGRHCYGGHGSQRSHLAHPRSLSVRRLPGAPQCSQMCRDSSFASRNAVKIASPVGIAVICRSPIFSLTSKIAKRAPCRAKSRFSAATYGSIVSNVATISPNQPSPHWICSSINEQRPSGSLNQSGQRRRICSSRSGLIGAPCTGRT